MLIQVCAGLLASTILVSATMVFAQQSEKSDDPQHACNSATSQMELNQCAGEQYHKADARLNAIYRKALEIMQKNLADAQEQRDAQLIKSSQQSIEKLKAAERAWIQYRDLHCDAAGQQYEADDLGVLHGGNNAASRNRNEIRIRRRRPQARITSH
jgi:uncharacterized protein YecT (DUF1311 family)